VWSRREARRLKPAEQTSRILPRSFAAIVVALLASAAGGALAQSGTQGAFDRMPSPGFRFSETTGEALYANVCQACHMPDGKGATGAGTYPSLAGDKNLEAGGFAVSVLVHGQRGMPPVGLMMTNDQVAAVVNYVRTHFGNHYNDAVSSEEVKAARQ
jgi:mono/diheme cytochrome c family protein